MREERERRGLHAGFWCGYLCGKGKRKNLKGTETSRLSLKLSYLSLFREVCEAHTNIHNQAPKMCCSVKTCSTKKLYQETFGPIKCVLFLNQLGEGRQFKFITMKYLLMNLVRWYSISHSLSP